ncbi:unnamed protein product [Periconia digitata]|uniref:Uncharacterized protein n=1 Tax=Periconia digitata TaxID=1303443 RepID=A0A9W4UFX2_9PLEO|nr:unnamed protein product [Periconia digitata]
MYPSVHTYPTNTLPIILHGPSSLTRVRTCSRSTSTLGAAYSPATPAQPVSLYPPA